MFLGPVFVSTVPNAVTGRMSRMGVKNRQCRKALNSGNNVACIEWRMVRDCWKYSDFIFKIFERDAVLFNQRV